MATDDFHCDVCNTRVEAATRYVCRGLSEAGIENTMCFRCSIVFSREIWKNLEKNPRFKELMFEVMDLIKEITPNED